MPDHRPDISRIATVLLWLLVIDLGIALGAGLYEARIVLPGWIDAAADAPTWNADAARADDTGRRFWAFVTTVPLTLLTLANLFVGWRAPAPLRRWWLATAGVSLAERAFTLGYFIPTMVGLLEAESTPASVAAAIRWAQLNNFRHLLTLAALLAGLRTFALLYERRGSPGPAREVG